MPHVLDRMVRPMGHFRPKTITEFFALQLARKLDDLANLQTHLVLAEHHSEQLLVRAFRRAVNDQGRMGSLSERFQAERERLKHKEEKHGFGIGGD